MYRYLFLLLSVVFYFGCQKKMQRSFLMSHPPEFKSDVPVEYEQGSLCSEVESYMPDLKHPEHTPVKHIRVNFHIVNNSDTTGNFDEEMGRIFINEVMYCSNNKLTRNKPMHLPLGNKTPVLPMRYQYVLTPDPNIPGDDGIYFHYDDDLYYVMNNGPRKNNFSQEAYRKYGNRKDTVMNVFVLDFPVDSVNSSSYKRNSNGVAYGPWVKVVGWYSDVRDTTWLDDGTWKTKRGKWFAQKNLNHEIGHNLGLGHTWSGNDGCEDTPNHPNCYSHSSSGPCKDGWSNNFMDYNSRSSAWSPCQIGKAHQNMMGMGRKKKLRAMLEPTWCTLDPLQKIVIEDSISWNGAKDLESHVEVRNGGTLVIRCSISFPKGAKMVVYPGGKLILDGAILYNDCGEQWEGIEIMKYGKAKGEVIYGKAGAEILDVANGNFD